MEVSSGIAQSLHLCCVAIGSTTVIGFAMVVHLPHWRFEHSLQVGMSKDRIEHSVGPPDRILTAGSVLERWGNAEQRSSYRNVGLFCLSKEPASNDT